MNKPSLGHGANLFAANTAMSVLAPSTGSPYQMPPFPVRRFTVDEYHRMIQAAVLEEDDAVELLEGWITPKMPRNPRHDATIDQSHEVLRGALPATLRVRVQSAITTADSEPEPDLAVVPGPASRYAVHNPNPGEVALVIEAADSSLDHDRQVKGPLYAKANIPSYWIMNLPDSRVEAYSDPTGPDAIPCYRARRDFGLQDFVPLTIAGQVVAQIAVRDLFA